MQMIHDQTLSATETYQEAVFLRGWFVTRYAAVEFAVAELLLRSAKHPAYDWVPDLKYGLTERLKQLRRVLDAEGPLIPFKAELLLAVEELPTLDRYRHLLTHGLMAPYLEPEPGVRLKTYDTPKGEGFGLISLELPLAQFRILVERIEPISLAVTAAAAQACRGIPLPLLSAEPERPLLR